MYISKYLVLTILIVCTILFSFSAVEAFTDPSDMTDQTFFGVWNGSTWTTVGKINYSYSSGLTSVENAVKAGNYATAKTELLNYYKNRTTRTVIPYSSSDRNTNYANIVSDDIFTPVNEIYVETFTVNNNYQTVQANVLDEIQSSMNEDKQITFILMARTKTTSIAKFYSKENASNKPRLEVTVNGTPQTLYPVKDAYIRPGTYGDVNYGTSTLLEVEDWGVPFNDDTRRTYMQFDMSGLAATPTVATLKLYGRNATGTGNKDVMVYTTVDTSWVESTTTWNNTLGSTFSWQGVSTSTDWNQPSSGAEKEWMYLITRFGFAGALAYEYNQTATESYANDLIRLMLDFITDKSISYPRSLDTASRATNWVRAYHYIKGSTSMDGPANSAILKELWQVADWLAYDPDGYTSDNWAVQETRGLYNIAVYFPEFSAASDWQSIANTRIDDLIKTLNFIDGSYIEASTHYTGVALDIFYSIKKMGELNSQTFNSTFDMAVKRLGKYVMDFSFPNGYDPQYGDSDYIDHKSSVLDVGNTYNDSGLIYFGSDGASGTAPSYTSITYPDHKTAIMRTGWQDNDLYMYISNNAGAHGHPDQLGVMAYGYGRPLIVDPGRCSYAQTTIPLWLRGKTEAHNTIEINDILQERFNYSGNVCPDTIDDWTTNDYYDFIEGTTTSTGRFIHNRSVLFIKPGYWIVSDYVKADTGTNKYQQTWHMLPTANLTLDGTTKKVKTNFGDSYGNIQVVPADPTSLTASLDDGYYSSDYLNASDAEYVSYVKNVSGDVTFDTVLYPTASGDNRDVRVTRLATTPSVSTTVATALKVDFNYGAGGNTGYYYLSHESAPNKARTFDEFNFNGKMAYAEKDSSNNLSSAAIKSGKTLKRNGNPLISSNFEIEDIAVKWNGTTIEISGDDLKLDTNKSTAISIYAPSVTSVKLNGSAIPYAKTGDYIYAVSQKKVVYSATNDFSSVQGSYNWYYQKDNGNYASLPSWYAADNNGGTEESDSFSSSTLGSQWSWVREDNTKWSLTANPGKMRITTQTGDVWLTSNDMKNILIQAPPYPNYTVTTKLTFNPTTNYQMAGLIIYGDDDNYLKLERSYINGKVFRIINEKLVNGSPSGYVQTATDTLGGTVYLKLVKSGISYSGYYSSDGVEWTLVGITLPDVPINNPKIGVFATNSSGAPSINADFDYFNIVEPREDRWMDTSGTDPSIAKYYQTTDTAEDSVRKWVAPADGVINISGTVGSYGAYVSGDGFNGKILKNSSNVWPESGWQYIARDNTAGYYVNETLTVSAGDVIYLITNRNVTTTNDKAKWDVNITLYPGATLFYDDFEDGNANGWTPLTSSRWTVGPDGGNYKYYINTTSYSSLSGDRLGEYSLIDGSNYDSFKINLKARQGDDVTTNSWADYAVLFNYKDTNNYYYMMFNNKASCVQLFKVKSGIRQLMADSNGTDWVTDNNYHSISIERNGATGRIVVSYDNNIIIRTSDTEFSGGQIGIGSYNDSAYFDEVAVINLNEGSDTFNSSTLDSKWSWVREDDTKWSLVANSGCMRITTQLGDIWYGSNNEKNILLQAPQYTDYTITTKLTFSPTTNYQTAGLIVYTDDDNYIKVQRAYANGNYFRLLKEVNGTGSCQIAADTLGSTVYLKLVKSGTSYSGYYSSNGTTWTQIGSAYTGVSLSNPKAGLHAMHSGSASSLNADFDYFDIAAYNPYGSDTFGSTTLDSKWSWMREDDTKWSLTANPGYMRITTQSGDIWWGSNNEKNILLQAPQYTDYTITTKLTFSPTTNYQTSGLIIYTDDDNYIKVQRAYVNGNYFRLLKEVSGIGNCQTANDTLGATVYLKIVKSGTSYSGYYSSNGTAWTQIGNTVTDVSLPGQKVGLHAMHSGSASSLNADFDDFSISN